MKRSVEMRQQRAKLYNDAQALIPAAGQAWTSETRTKFDTMMADMDVMKDDIVKVEKLESIGTELEAPVGAGVGASAYTLNAGGDEVDPKILEAQERSYQKVFRSYLQRGLSGLSEPELMLLRTRGRSNEYRGTSAQDNTSGPGGGYLIPAGFQAELEVAMKWYGGMRQAARVITTGAGNVLPWPTTNDTNVSGRRLGANADANPAVTSSQAFGQITFNAWTYTSDVIRIPNELINDAAFDLVAEVNARFGERLGRIQNAEFTNLVGAGSGPNGFLPLATVAKTGATGQTTSIAYDDIIDLEHGIDVAYRNGAGYMCNDIMSGTLRKVKDSYGRPLFGAGLEEAAPDTLNGRPLWTNNDMPVPAANARSLAFGQFKKYIIRDVAGSAVVVRLTEMYALQNETAFVAFLRSDGNLVDAGTHPIAVYKQSAT